jgi:polysaccharide export outer membrane protein
MSVSEAERRHSKNTESAKVGTQARTPRKRDLNRVGVEERMYSYRNQYLRRIEKALRPARVSFAIISFAGIAGLALSCCGCFGGRPVETKVVQDAAQPDPGPYRIGRGDSLDLLVWGHDQLSGRLHVADDGSVTLPLIGQTEAAGLTTSQLQRRLTIKLSRFLHAPNVMVRVANPASQVFFVLGEVKRAGKYELTSGEVLSQALAEAGGPTEFANLRKVKIIRHVDDRPMELTVNYNTVASDGDLSADVPISRGDTIVVP